MNTNTTVLARTPACFSSGLTMASVVLAAILLSCGSSAVGQQAEARIAARRPNPAGLNQRDLIRGLIQLQEDNSGNRIRRLMVTIAYADELIARYPDSEYHDEAMIVKMASLLGLGSAHPAYLDALQELIQTIECGEPSLNLATEAAYFEMQAFAARAEAEGLSAESGLLGTGILQEQFLNEHPDSRRVPAVAAGYIYNLVDRGEIQEARRQLDKWGKIYPEASWLVRAEGRWFRAQAVGKPFAIDTKSADGYAIRTGDYAGNVVLVHLWSAWTDADRKHLPSLVQLHKEFAPKGLQIIGVNLDRDRKRADSAIADLQMDWPQFFDKRGFNSEICVRHAVRSVPTMFVIDGKGVLRSIDSGEDVREEVSRWLSSE